MDHDPPKSLPLPYEPPRNDVYDKTLNMKKVYLLLFFVASMVAGFGQSSVKDSSVFSTLFYATYSYQVPGGDMAKHFGNNSSIGGGILFKTRKNWLMGADGHYLFGGKVKNSGELLKNISTTDGNIIDANGMYAEVLFSERGYAMYARFGKMFPVLGPNPNSGPFILGSMGYLQHKIRIDNPNTVVPQIKGDYKKGYDRLAGGFSLSESIGYLYMGNVRWINFMVALEYTQAWTKSKRDYAFDMMKKDNSKYKDYFYGIRVAWFIPVYKRSPKDFYYY